MSELFSQQVSQQLPSQVVKVLQNADSSTLILTPNQRLSRYLHSCYDQLQLAHKRESWPALQCMPRSAWYKQLWQQVQLKASHSQAAWYVPNNLQEQALWREVSEQHACPWPLLNPQLLQKLAAEAWQNLRLWRIPLAELETKWSQLEEVELLLSWIRAYEQRRCNQQWLDQPALIQLLADSPDPILIPAKIYLYGFEKPEPLFLHFLASLRTRACVIEDLACTQVHSAKAKRFVADDVDGELLQAARWAAALNANEPQARIAIVIPELAQMQDKVERIFNEVFNPQCNRAHHRRHAPVFNISAARELARMPPIAAALHVLHLNRFEFEIEDVTGIITSVFIGDSASLNARQQFVTGLKARYLTIRSARLRAELANAAENTDELQIFYQQCCEFFAVMRGKHSELLSAESWMRLFQQQLQALGWPGTRTPDSLEYQQLSQWQQVLDNFVSLDVNNKPMKLEDALAAFHQAALVPFHVQTEDSPIQILGLLEAAGLHFDYLWLAQMDELHWPPAPAPNPLLPLKLQIETDMPRASQQGELVYAQNLMQSLSLCTRELILSHARHGQSEELQVSPLIQSVTQVNVLPQADVFCAETTKLEAIDNDEVAALERETSQGGTQILRDFAACPFKAFARYRLHAQANDEMRSGIDAITRGNLIHQSLDNLWHRLRTQQALLTLEESEEHKLVRQVVEAAWNKITSGRDISSSLQTLELERSYALIHNWLKLEKQRQNFTVRERERAHLIQVGNLPLQVRYDRVDELDDGSLMVIDYKTSPYHSVSQWAGERPDEPQVPLYALANKQQVSAAAFALVSARKTAFEGLQKNAGTAPGLRQADDAKQKLLPASWEDILEHWETVLSDLANRWLRGEAEVDPKYAQQSCQRCDLHALCRIKEKLAIEDLAEGAEEGDD